MGRHSTARVAPLAQQGVRRGDLPGWFWGALGCLTVLVVGLSIVFILGQSGAVAPTGAPAGSNASTATPTATAAVAPSAPARAGGAQRAGAPGIQIEPMAPPPSAADHAPPPVRAKIKPIKVAHSPAAARPAGTAKATAAAAAPAESDDDSDDEPKAKPRAAAAAADDDSEEK
ncbi:MAG TPA: hypothetical protein VN903_21280 [Polyangia bacterium]|nr:hypothetical protein [Polyangia bacterium]